MDLEDGILFLLRRAGILSQEDALDTVSEKDRAVASSLVNELGGLPLALDQAGAYMEETGCSLSSLSLPIQKTLYHAAQTTKSIFRIPPYRSNNLVAVFPKGRKKQSCRRRNAAALCIPAPGCYP